MRLSWALVHSKQPEDVQRGIAMLEGKRQKLSVIFILPHPTSSC
jgi:fission 1 protein